MRVKSSAPTTSTSDTATCSTTSARRTANRAPPSVVPRPPAFIAAPGEAAVARIAGVSPNIRQAATATLAVNANTRQSSVSGRNSGLPALTEEGDEEAAEPLRRQQPAGGADRGDEQAFGQHLAHDPPA